MDRVRGSQRLDGLTAFWWVSVPLLARRVSAGLSDALTDGHYLAAWRVSALAAPLAAFLTGLFVGAKHWGLRTQFMEMVRGEALWFERAYWGFPTAFTEALIVMQIGAVIGFIGAHLGVLFTAGFAIGDFFIAQPTWPAKDLLGHALRVRVPLLIEYSLLALLTASIPAATSALAAAFAPRLRLGRFGRWVETAGRWARVIVRAGVHAFLAFWLTYLWAQAAPLLIRPVFTWRAGEVPPVSAMWPLQMHPFAVPVAALVTSVLVSLVQAWISTRPALTARVVAVEEQLRRGQSVQPLERRLTPWITVPAGAVWSTLMLAGMISSWLWAIVMVALFLAVGWARAGLLRVPLGAWARIMDRLWLPLRIALPLAVIVLFTQAVLKPGRLPQTMTNFDSYLALTGLAVIVTYLFNPRRADAPTPGRSAALAARPAALALAGGGTLLALSVLFPEAAFADNCSTPADCHGTGRAAMLGLLGVSMVVSFLPVAGEFKGIVELFTGEDVFTKQKIPLGWRILGAIPVLGRVAKLAKGARAVQALTRGSGGAEKAYQYYKAAQLARRMEQGGRILGTAERGAVAAERAAQGLATAERGAQALVTAERAAQGLGTAERAAQGAATVERAAQGAATAERVAQGAATVERAGQAAATAERAGQAAATAQRGAQGAQTVARTAGQRSAALSQGGVRPALPPPRPTTMVLPGKGPSTKFGPSPNIRTQADRVRAMQQANTAVKGAIPLTKPAAGKGTQIQRFRENCALTAIRTVVNNAGKNLPQSQRALREHAKNAGLFQSGGGMQAAQIKTALEKLGAQSAIMPAGGSVKNIEAALNRGHQVIAGIRTPGGAGHAVNIEKVVKGVVFYGDPASGRSFAVRAVDFQKQLLTAISAKF